MSEAYRQLLDATIAHLEELRASGRRFVSVSPETLGALSGAAAPVAAAAAAAPSPRPASLQSALRSTVSPARIPPAPPPREPAPSLIPPAPALNLSGPVLEPAAKEAAMAELRSRVLACLMCAKLAAARQNVVFGVGDIHSPLMFVGEAPGADEDQLGEPFVGKAGQLLTKIIETMGLNRSKVYIANILKCRPDTPGQDSGNRKPTPQEMATCKPYLLRQVEIIRPRVIVALGATAVEGLLGNTTGITRLRGNWQNFHGIPVMPTYHPAYLLRNQALSEKRRVWEDMLQVMEKLGMPVSEKQRGYFSKGA